MVETLTELWTTSTPRRVTMLVVASARTATFLFQQAGRSPLTAAVYSRMLSRNTPGGLMCLSSVTEMAMALQLTPRAGGTPTCSSRVVASTSPDHAPFVSSLLRSKPAAPSLFFKDTYLIV